MLMMMLGMVKDTTILLAIPGPNNSSQTVTFLARYDDVNDDVDEDGRC